MEKWVQSRLGEIVYARQGQELRVNCPFCFARTGREDTKKHLYINVAKSVAHCFRCDWQGHHVSLVMNVEGCTYAEALQYMWHPPTDVGLFEKIYSPCGLVQASKIVSKPAGFVPMTHVLAGDLMREYSVVQQYILKRGVPIDLMVRCFGYVPGTHRVWILVDESWWQGRLIIPGEPKYISPPWSRDDSLWNAQALKYKDIIICEGVFSAIAVGDNAVALCGKTMTDAQAVRLVDADIGKLTLMLDYGAEENAFAMAKRLEYFGFNGELVVQYMKSGDPADGVVGDSVEWSWEVELKGQFEV